MTFDPEKYRDFLEKGEPARLFPTVPGSAKEHRTCSIFLAVLMAVPSFSKELLQELGAPASKLATIHCYTEPVFKGQSDTKLRPDGLIVVCRGQDTWKALVETKIDNQELRSDQLEGYLRLARENSCHALITISNQFTSRPTLHPVAVSGHLTRSVDLFHWSWVYLRSCALMQLNYFGIEDREQAFITEEFLRYLGAPKSGVVDFTSMSASWKDLCDAVRNENALTKTGDMEKSVVGDWHQLLRSLSLELSTQVGSVVEVHLPRAQKKDAKLREDADLENLKTKSCLRAELNIPNASSRLYLDISIPKRRLTASMWVDAPQDKKFASACQTWIKNQLYYCEDPDIRLQALYRGNGVNPQKTLAEVREDKNALTSTDTQRLPTGYWVYRQVFPGQNFNSRKRFVSAVSELVYGFYEEVGEDLVNWVPPAPKVQRSTEGSSDGAPGWPDDEEQ